MYHILTLPYSDVFPTLPMFFPYPKHLPHLYRGFSHCTEVFSRPASMSQHPRTLCLTPLRFA